MQSVYEKPDGPLTLRIYASNPGSPCQGELYLDDGKSYAYQHGDYLRMKFACEITNNSLRLHIGAHDGSYPSWWKEIRAEVYGWKPEQKVVSLNGKTEPLSIQTSGTAAIFTIADDAKGVDVELK